MIPRPRCARVKCPVDTLVLAPGMFIESTIRKYIQDQEKADIALDKLSVREYEDPFSK